MSPAGPLLVLAPHADDEALGCGALLAERCAAGANVQVAYFTDSSGPSHSQALTNTREQESRRAMGLLGLRDEALHFLGAPDGRLKHLTDDERHHWRAMLRDLLLAVKPAEVLLPCRADGSSEHEAMFTLFAEALRATGLQSRVLEFPVWAWWNPRFLWPELWSQRKVWHHPVGAYAAKKAALLQCYPSQTESVSPSAEPILSGEFLAAFRGSDEFYFESPLSP